MSTIRVVWGAATAPTEMAAYDAALADAGIENYNLVPVSSVIPAGVDVEAVGTAPDLGPAGNRLTVVEAAATAAGPSSVSAALGWVQSVEDGPGLFYEAAGEIDAADVETRVLEGLAAGSDLREWELGDPRIRVETARAESGTYTAAVVIAVYGESEPIV
ncbi:pyruvoyl-dependent arginine decarboxylase [Natrialbaceae archaeon AArc-T1-2]|uniref:pyruvoyl-dependent arginine decarboxylase n=1 Tax=Natrialbaceae archaeon AArc-T1-2 TaxID=3053904 RepID=UPI00255A83B5|nr:pyruvoyl-dependent arginine decarboxylase [Natrialbaceae archaeon AArc-T1-2]WIV66268.1 pyruvoyl-dependent arginine decarboxylase [Natrialbaceae archaeon AArc-T1-2]